MSRARANRGTIVRGVTPGNRAKPVVAAPTAPAHGPNGQNGTSQDEEMDFLRERCDMKAAKDVRDNLGVVVNEARYQGKCTIITQHGKAAAAVVPIHGLSTMLRAVSG